MIYYFENGCKTAEALITGVEYNKLKQKYFLSLLAKEDNCPSFTKKGTAWITEDEMKNLLASNQLDSADKIIGRKAQLKPISKEAQMQLLYDELDSDSDEILIDYVEEDMCNEKEVRA